MGNICTGNRKLETAPKVIKIVFNASDIRRRKRKKRKKRKNKRHKYDDKVEREVWLQCGG